LPYWFLPPTPTPPNAHITNTRSSQNTYPGVHIQSPGLLQLNALWCVRQSYPKSSVHPERRCSASHWSRTTRPYFAGFAAVAPAASSTGCQFRDALTTYKLTCFVFSSLSGHAPPYLADDIHLVSEGHRRRLRSSTDRSCAVSRTHDAFGDRSFTVAGPRVWNSLPAHLRDEGITYGSFRRVLKTFRFNVASGAGRNETFVNCAI